MKSILSRPVALLSLLLIFFTLTAHSQYGPFYSKERALSDYSLYTNYNEIIKEYNANKDIGKALTQIDSLASIVHNQKDYNQFLFLKNEVSNFYKFDSEFNKGFTDLHSAMQIYKEHSDTINLEYAVSLRLLRGLLTRSSLHSKEKEEDMLKSQLNILDSLKINGEPMTNTLVDYGLFLNRNGKPNESFDMLYRARTTALTNNDLMSLAVADYTLISNTNGIDLEHTIIEVLQNDLLLLKQAQQNIPTLVYTSFFNYMLGNRFYWDMNDVNKSVEYNLKAAECLDTLQYPMWNLKSSSHSLLALCYSDLNDTLNFWHHFRVAKELTHNKPMSDYNRGLAYITLVEAALTIAPDSSQAILDTLKNHNASQLFEERIIKNQALIFLRQEKLTQAIEIINGQFVKFDEIDNHKIPSLSDSIAHKVQLEYFDILNTCYTKLESKNHNTSYKNVLVSLIAKQNDLYKTIVQNEVFGLEISSIIAKYNNFVNQSLSYLLKNYNPKTDEELAIQLFFSSKAIQLNNNLGKSYLQSQMENDSHQFMQLLSTVHEVNSIKANLASEQLSTDERETQNRRLNKVLIESLVTKQRVSRGIEFNIQSISIPTLTQIQNLLEPKQGLIELCHNDSILNWIIITAHNVKIGQKVVPNLSDEITREIYNIKTGGTVSELGTTLFCPAITAEIDAINSLVIIPTSQLAQIPFEWLKLPQKSNKLIETHTISYSYSTSLWYRTKINAKNISNPSLLTVAPFINNETKPTMQLASDYRGTMPLPQLLSTKEEVEKIASLFELKNSLALSLVGEQATGLNLEPQLNKFDILHLATHGLINRINPERSGLYLYPTQEDSETESALEENFLSLAKLQNLKISANLAVLSACNTGTGAIAEGEGVMALPRGFIFAGVPNVIASLWKVHDEKTKELMVAFYTHLLNGETYANALRLAKLNCIAKGFLPIDWASFVLIGS